MGWLENIQAATKALNSALDNVEKNIKNMVDAKIKNIDASGNKIITSLDSDLKLIDSTVNNILETHKKQIELDTKFASDNPGKDLQNVTNLVSKFDPKTIKLSSIAKKDNTYLTPTDLVLSQSEAKNIRSQLNTVSIKDFTNFRQQMGGLDPGQMDPKVVNVGGYSTLHRYRQMDVPEPQLISIHSRPLKERASLWDLKIDILFDKRNEALKRADRDVQASYLRLMDFRKELTKKQDDALSVIPKNDDLISQLGDEKTIANLKEQLLHQIEPKIHENIQEQIANQQKFLDASASRFKDETQQQSAIDFSVIQQRNIEDKDQSVNAVRDLKAALDSPRYIALFDAANRLKHAKKVYKSRPVVYQYTAPSRIKPKELDLRARFNLMID